MNAAYLRKLVSDEFRELLMFAGLVNDYHCKTKVLDGKNAYYSFDTLIGECRVMSSRTIYIKDKKFSSLTEARQEIYKYL
jgi:hypothetical protein